MGQSLSDPEPIVTEIIDAAVKLHRKLGPGLLESVYKTSLCADLVLRGLSVQREVPVLLILDGRKLGKSFSVDLLVNAAVVVEVKAIKRLAPVHFRQISTYLKLLELPIGLLMNFGGATLKQGLHRIVNGYVPTPSSPLRINKMRHR